MYKDVVKRVIAWVLVLCMIGGIPDVSLWATEISARSSDGGGNHTYALENKVEEKNGEIINTGQRLPLRTLFGWMEHMTIPGFMPRD